MNWIRKYWTLFSIIILVSSAGWIIFSLPAGNQISSGDIPAPREGFLAPDFTLQDEHGQSVRLSDLYGQPVLLNIWASWCSPCKAEMPAMQTVYEAYASQGFTILAINTTYQDERGSALGFASGLGLTFPILFDEDGSVARAYRVQAMPTSFFIDRKGVISKAIFGGPMPEALLRVEIEKILSEEP